MRISIKPKQLNQRGFDHAILGIAVVVVFAVIGTSFLVLSHGASWSGELYLGYDHSLCLDNNGNSSASKNKVDIYKCNGSAAQNWSIVSTSNGFLLKDKAGTCLDDQGLGGSGARVQTYTCNTADHAQHFTWNHSQLQTFYKNVCVNDPGYSKSNGTALIMYACNGTSNEQWYEASQSSGGGGNGGGSSEAALAKQICNSMPTGFTSAECADVADAVNIVASNSQWSSYNNSTQLMCLGQLWYLESTWRWWAANSSGAYGIPQALPGSKMASAGSDWKTNPNTQIKWGLGYIKSTYGTPCNALAFENHNHYYITMQSPNGTTVKQ